MLQLSEVTSDFPLLPLKVDEKGLRLAVYKVCENWPSDVALSVFRKFVAMCLQGATTPQNAEEDAVWKTYLEVVPYFN